jgi:hypothetical protein
MWVLKKISNPKVDPAEGDGVQQAVDLLNQFLAPEKCAGAVGLSKKDTIVIGFMKQRITEAEEAKGQLRKAENNSDSTMVGSQAASFSKTSTSKAEGLR